MSLTALSFLKKHKLDALLLNINMPDIDGYRLCEHLKAHQSTADLPIIFISESDGIEDVTKGYSSGCDDYLFKPIERGDQLTPKIKHLIKSRNRFRELKQESKSNLIAAGKAMSDLASLNTLYRQMIETQTKDETINLCFEYVSSFKLSLICRLTYGDHYFYFSNGKRVSELDKEVINTKEVKGQFTDFGNRTLIRMGNIRLLLKNMPLYDFEAHDYQKHTIIMMLAMVNQQTQLIYDKECSIELMNITSTITRDLQISFAKIKESNYELISELKEEIEQGFNQLNLDEEQEVLLKNIFEQAITKSDESIDEQKTIETNIEKVLNILKFNNSL